ncbi:flavorubredoxin [Elusimicrobium simillimum]|uniref:FprA family A-type flavoprotein n=1 Tax=Elusimicrobium simillimum TaxID=3143438 RepID=UPI003C6FDAF9
MKAIKITDKVYWVGAIDWNLKDFHGYSTKRGTTYNAYLVLGAKPTLIDTVKEPFYDEMMSRIKSVIDPSKIEIIISNHAEMDHSGALPKTVEVIKPKEIYASAMGLKNIDLQLHDNLQIKTVKTGDSIDIGDDKITFYESRMLHWPDSMVSFLENEGILFSNDIFGMHFATDRLFDDQVDEHEWFYECVKYYANIITPYSDIALKFLEFAETSGLIAKTKIIAPDHGFIWRSDPARIVNLYKEFATQAYTNKAVVIYDTMWGSTNKLAHSVAEGLRQGGVNVKVMNMHVEHRSDVVTEVLTAGAVVMGTPVMNSYMFPALGDILFYMKGLKKKNLVGAAFGSYGWAPAPIDMLSKEMESMKIEIVAEPLKVNFVPTEADLEKAEELGRTVAKKLAEKLK